MQGRENARFPCTPSPKPTSTTNKKRLAARTGKKLGCGNDARWNPWKSPTPTFPPLPPHLEIPQQTRDSHISTATTTTGYRGLDQHQTKINTNNKTKVVYTDNLTHPILYRFPDRSASNCSIVCSSTPAAPRLDLTALYASYTKRLSMLNGLLVACIEFILSPVVSVMQPPDPTPSL